MHSDEAEEIPLDIPSRSLSEGLAASPRYQSYKQTSERHQEGSI